MTFFILLVFFTGPQIYIILPYTIRVGFFDLYWADLLTGGVFIFWLTRLLHTKSSFKGFQLKINKIYFMILLIGLISIFVGLIKERENLLYAYRFFFYFVWVPVLIQFLQKPQRAMKALICLIIMNLISVIIALCTHFADVGLQIGYLNNYLELNLFSLLVLLSFFLAKKPLIGKRIDVLIFIICMLALIFDQSRRMYIAFFLGGIMLFVNYFRIYKGKMKISSALKIVLLVVIIIGFFGLWDKIMERVKTALVTPSQLQTGEIEPSAFFRMYALIGSLELIKEHPFIGVGAGNPIEIQNWLAKGLSLGYIGTLSPHNFYISASLYYGIPIVLWIYYIIYRLIKRSFRELRRAPPYLKKQGITALGMIVGLISFMVAMFFEGFEVRTIVDSWLFLGLMLGFVNLHSKIILTKQHT